MARPVTSIVDDDPVFGIERQTWPHVLRLHVHRGVIASAIRWLSKKLPSTLQHRLPAWFPGPFLPDTVIIKASKPDWDEEFNNEIQAYHRLRPIQGVVVPVCYGVTTVEGGTRALLLSDVGGRQLATVSYADHGFDELKGMVRTAIGAIYRLGMSPYDANLVNCHVVGGRVMVVDHEQDEVLEDDMEYRLDKLIEAKTDSIMSRHWNVHKPKKRKDPEAERRAHEAWKVRYSHILLPVSQAAVTMGQSH